MGAGDGAATAERQPGASALDIHLLRKRLFGRTRRGIDEIAGVKVLARRVPALPANELRNLADTFRGKLKSGVVLLGTETEGKVTLLAAVTADVVARVSADDLAQAMAPVVGGRAAGSPTSRRRAAGTPRRSRRRWRRASRRCGSAWFRLSPPLGYIFGP